MITKTRTSRLRQGFVAVAVTGLAVSLGPVIPAAASEISVLGENEKSTLTAFLADLDLSKETIGKLIEKADAGQTWDSGSGVEPVNTTTEVKDEFNYTIETFADGSVNRTGIEIPIVIPEGSVAPMTVDDCTKTGGAPTWYWSNCRVTGNWFNVNMAFSANFQNNNPAAVGPYFNPYISRVWDQGTVCVLCTYTQEFFGYDLRTGSASSPAVARYQVSSSGVLGSSTVRLRLFVPMFGNPSSTIVSP